MWMSVLLLLMDVIKTVLILMALTGVTVILDII